MTGPSAPATPPALTASDAATLPDRAADLARAMLDGALRRLPDDVRRYLHDADWLRHDRCELCEEEARATRGGGSSQRRATRFKA